MSPHLAAKLAPDLVSSLILAMTGDDLILITRSSRSHSRRAMTSLSVVLRATLGSASRSWEARGGRYIWRRREVSGVSFRLGLSATPLTTTRCPLPRPPSAAYSSNLPSTTPATLHPHRFPASRRHFHHPLILRIPPHAGLLHLRSAVHSSPLLPERRFPCALFRGARDPILFHHTPS